MTSPLITDTPTVDIPGWLFDRLGWWLFVVLACVELLVFFGLLMYFTKRPPQ